MRRGWGIVGASIATELCVGCAVDGPPDAAPGFNHREQQVLAHGWGWTGKWDHSAYTNGELTRLMQKSTEPGLDGERGENYSLELAGALVTVGGHRFALLLASEPASVQRGVAFHAHLLWGYYHLQYPETQVLLQSSLETLRHDHRL